jgi:hypothetical protein
MRAAMYCRECKTLRVREYPETRCVSSSLAGMSLSHREDYRLDAQGCAIRPEDELQCGCGGWCNCLSEEGMEAFLRLNGLEVLHKEEIAG